MEATGVVSSFQVPPGPLPGNSYTVPNVACNVPGSKAVLSVPGTSVRVEGAQDNLCTTMEVNIDANAACPAKLQFEAFGTCSNDPQTQIRGANVAYVYADLDYPDSPPRAHPGTA